ncbi:MAG: CoA-binding domain protein [Chthonomonadaceae bacterium]|nr:CoA-binding domain protein [Chthonomonadaceae bacterium]
MSILIDETTPILVQGITGREARMFTLQSCEYGANVVAGVTPGRGGEDVDGIPVYDTVSEALEHHPIDATLVSVPPAAAGDAALEAIVEGVGLVVVTTERIPQRDVAMFLEAARQHGTTVVGPNSLGIVVPDRTRIGAAGGSAEHARRWYAPGDVAVLSRSGGMMTEIAAMLTVAGIGQRICVSIGGDAMIGSGFVDLYRELRQDPGTRAVVVFGEPGGIQEEHLAEYLADEPGGPPVAAFITGRFADRMHGVRFGHAAAIVTGSSGSPSRKRELLGEAGAMVADRLDEIPRLLAAVLPA